MSPIRKSSNTNNNNNNQRQQKMSMKPGKMEAKTAKYYHHSQPCLRYQNKSKEMQQQQLIQQQIENERRKKQQRAENKEKNVPKYLRNVESKLKQDIRKDRAQFLKKIKEKQHLIDELAKFGLGITKKHLLFFFCFFVFFFVFHDIIFACLCFSDRTHQQNLETQQKNKNNNIQHRRPSKKEKIRN